LYNDRLKIAERLMEQSAIFISNLILQLKGYGIKRSFFLANDYVRKVRYIAKVGDGIGNSQLQ